MANYPYKKVLLVDDNDIGIIPYINPATSTELGAVKPDNRTITITNDGTISAIGGQGGFSGTVGSNINPIWLNDGIPTGSTATVGNANTPVYLSNGTITSTNMSIANTRFDGQWVYKYNEFSGTNFPTTPGTVTWNFNANNYLPDMSNAYEVFVVLQVNWDGLSNLDSTAYNYHYLFSVSTAVPTIIKNTQHTVFVTPNAPGFIMVEVDQSSAETETACGILPIPANNRQLQFTYASARTKAIIAWNSSKSNCPYGIVQLLGYRRIGTNS